LPISSKVSLFFLLYLLLLRHPISWHSSEAMQVSAEPVSKMTSNLLFPCSVPTDSSPMNIVFATFDRRMEACSKIGSDDYFLIFLETRFLP
jgi:hypothetical protein